MTETVSAKPLFRRQLLKYLIKAIGGEIASDTNMTHLVAKEFRRTVKWYCAMHIAKYAVTPEWVNESFSSKWFLDEEKFWLSDPRKEQVFNFHIRQSIERAREHRVFNGFRFALLCEKVIPSPEVLEKIIRSGGGRFLTAMPSIKSLLSVKKQREDDPRSCWPGFSCRIKEDRLIMFSYYNRKQR
jgi:hypothetical protein